MPLQYDPEFANLAGPQLEQQKKVIALHDVKVRRARIEGFVKKGVLPQLPEDVEQIIHYARAPDNHEIAIYHFGKKNVSSSDLGPAIIHIHDSAESLAMCIFRSGVPMFSIDYLLAPENQFPVPLEDYWSALLWIQTQAETLNIDCSRIAIIGESAGGGLGAGLTLLARDRGLSPPLAKQILIYPMLDDGTNSHPTESLAVFSVNDVIPGWAAYLGADYGTEKVTEYAASARTTDVKGLPHLYLEFDQLDFFEHKIVTYLQKFVAANIPTQFHLYEGLPHAFQRFAPSSTTAQQAIANRLGAMLSF